MASYERLGKYDSFAGYFLFSLSLGLRSLRPGFCKEPLARILNPLSYIRGTEYGLVLREIGPRPGDRILDIGSPKLPFLYLAAKSDATVIATDVRDYFIKPSRMFLKRLGKERLIGHRLFLETQDARALGYPDCSFDKVFSISVLEHIPGDGDSQTMAEIARILKPGGTVCLTVPYSHERPSEQYRGERCLRTASR